MDKYQFLREIYPDILLPRTFDRLRTLSDLKEVFMESEILIFIDEESSRFKIPSTERYNQICEKIAETLAILGGRDFIEFRKCLGFNTALNFTRKSSYIRKKVMKCLNQLSSTYPTANFNYYLLFADIFCLRKKFNGLYYKRLERFLREESKKI